MTLRVFMAGLFICAAVLLPAQEPPPADAGLFATEMEQAMLKMPGSAPRSKTP